MNLDDYNKVIKSSNINPKDYYYHAFNNYEINAYLSKGILSPILL